MHSESKSDIEILQACIQGNQQAFEQIVSKYQSLVCAITYSGTGCVNRSEELAQETFIMAWKNLAQLRDLGKFQAWLCRIARNIVQNWVRRRKRDVVAKATSLDSAPDQATRRFEPAQAAIQKEQAIVVSQALDHIPENHREPLVLFYRENKSTREVAELMGVSENTARQRIARARGMLKKQVAAMVETTLTETRPDKIFTAGVMASLAVLTIKSTVAVASAIPASGLGFTTALSGIAGKIALVAAGIAIITGGLLLHNHVTKETAIPASVPELSQTHESQNKPSSSQEALQAEALYQMQMRAQNHTNSPSTESPDTQDVVPDSVKRGTPVKTTALKTTEPHEFKPRGVLSGLITDSETGEPVQDALVEISNNGSSGRTDEHGFYFIEKIFRPGNCRILIQSNDYVGISYSNNTELINFSQNKQIVKHFQLSRACMVDLRVADANGVGIKGARVVTTSLADDMKREVGAHSMPHRTDPNGALLLGGIPPSHTDYLITVWHQETIREERLGNGIRLGFSRYDYSPAKAVVRLTDPNVIESVEIVLEKGEPVHGYADYEDGLPATDIQIEAEPSWWHCYGSSNHTPVNADGAFTLSHITPGTYNVKMATTSPEGLPQSSKRIMQVELPPADGKPLVLHLPMSSPQSLASISGQLVFSGDKKPGFVMVNAYSPTLGKELLSIPVMPGPSTTQVFSLDRLQPGDYRLTFSGDNFERKILRDVTAPCANLDVELHPTNASKPVIAGTVTDKTTGEPIKDFRIRLLKNKTLRGGNSVPPDQWIAYKGTDGRFEVESVGPGLYQVQGISQTYAPLLSEEVNTDHLEDVVLALTSGGTITGTVINQAGDPIDGAKIIPLSYAGGTMSKTQTAFASDHGACETRQGSFALSQLPAGIETLKITHPDYSVAVAEGIEVFEDQITKDIEIILTAGGTVEGVVYDELGIPMNNQVLYVQDEDGYSGTTAEMIGRLATVVTDPNGFYRVEHLPEQICYINRAEPWKIMGVTRRTAMPQEGKTLTLDFGGTPIVSGEIWVQGTPLAQRRIQLRTAGSSISATFQCFATTDNQGQFSFRGVAPGQCTIYYEAPETKDRWQKVNTFDMANTNLDLGVIGSRAFELRVHLQASTAFTSAAISRMYLSRMKSNSLLLIPKYRGEAPAAPEAPWIIPEVAAGTYTLVLMCQDQIQFRQKIVLEADQNPWEFSWKLPQQTARLSGSLGTSRQSCFLWQDTQESVITIVTDEQGAYSVDNLPVGTYFAGTAIHMLYNSPAIAQITLEAGQDRQFSPDLTASNNEQLATLMVQVIDDNGTIRNDASLSLAGDLGDIAPFNSIQGNYMFMATCGHHILHVVADGYPPIEKAVTLPQTELGTPPQSIQIRLKAAL